MKTCKFTLKSATPMSWSRVVSSEKKTGESNDAYDSRVWKEKIHHDAKGEIFIPPSAFKNVLYSVAKFLSESVPGKGKATYTKHFEAGLICHTPMYIKQNIKNLKSERLFVPSDGIKGSGKRVWKTFPYVPEWEGSSELLLLDPILVDKPEKVKEYLEHSGKFIGLGRFRPRNGGYYGMFEVTEFEVV